MNPNLPPIKVFAGTKSQYMGEEICENLGFQLGKMNITHFADGEFEVSFEESIRGCEVYLVQSTFPNCDNLMELLLMIDAAKRASAKSVIAVLPYFGWARQDRKDKPRVSIAAKLVSDILVTAGADRIITMDLHADQIQGFFNIPIDNLSAISLIGQYFRSKNLEDIVVVSPDHGGTTRARNLADLLNAPMAIIDKRRPKPNVAEAMNIIGDVEGKDVVIIDDMCDTAGSLVAGIKILKDKGAKDIYCAVSHGLLSGPAVERLNNAPIKEFVITNTIQLPEEKRNACPKITVLSVGYMLAKTIEAIKTHSPVSEVYDLFNDK